MHTYSMHIGFIHKDFIHIDIIHIDVIYLAYLYINTKGISKRFHEPKVCKKPKKDVVKLPEKGGMVPGKTMTLQSWGCIRPDLNFSFNHIPLAFALKSTAGCFSATTCANQKYLSVRGSRDW